MGELVADIGLPGVGVRLTVHPDAHRDEHDGRQKRAEPFVSSRLAPLMEMKKVAAAQVAPPATSAATQPP